MNEVELSDHDYIKDIDKRVAIIEAEAMNNRRTRLIIYGQSGLLMLALIGGVYGFGQLEQKVTALNLEKLEQDIGVALRVVADHGTELQDVRTEQARVRGTIDEMWKLHRDMMARIDARTAGRFYKSDGDRLEDRIIRLESVVFKNGDNNRTH